MKSFKILKICEICPAYHYKAKKIGVTKAVSLFAFCKFVVQFGLIWSHPGSREFFLLTGARKGTNRLNAPPKLRKFHRRKHD